MSFAGANLLDVGYDLVVGPILGDESHGRETRVDQGDGPVFHFARRIALGVDVGYLFELQRPLQRDGILVLPADVEEVLRGAVPRGELAHAA